MIAESTEVVEDCIKYPKRTSEFEVQAYLYYKMPKAGLDTQTKTQQAKCKRS